MATARTGVASGLTVLLLSASALAQGDDARAGLLTALAGNGCAVTEAETPHVFGAHGFEPEYVRRELGRMVLDGTAFLQGGTVLRAHAAFCPPAEPAPTPADRFRATVEAQGCRIDEDGLAEAGIDPAALRPVVRTWVADGTASVEGRSLVLAGCE